MAGRHLVHWFVVVVAVAALRVISVASEKEKKMFVIGAYTCQGEDPNAFGNLEFEDETDSEYLKINATLNIVADVTNITVTGIMEKCKTDDQDPGVIECEGLGEATDFLDFCEHVGDEGYIWSDVTRNIVDFPATCPIASGNYAVVNAPVNLGPYIATEDLTEGTWLYQLVFSNAGAEFACFEIAFEYGFERSSSKME